MAMKLNGLLNGFPNRLSHSINCQTTTNVECVAFKWKIDDFSKLRRLAQAEALPHKDRLVSNKFGNAASGFWHVVLYPFGEVGWRRHVSVFLHSECQEKRLADFSFVVVDAAGCEIDTTKQNFTFSFSKTTSNWGFPDFLTIHQNCDLEKFICDGALRIKITIEVLTVSTQSIDATSPEITSNIGAELKDFIQTTNTSDLRVVCGKRHFEAHRLVLAARSTVFRAKLFGELRDSKDIIVNDVPENIMSNLLSFCVNDDCDILRRTRSSPTSELVTLLEAAEKYEIKALANVCLKLLVEVSDKPNDKQSLSKTPPNDEKENEQDNEYVYI